MARDLFGFEATTVTRLPSYYDQNFLLSGSGCRRVLKIANSADDHQTLQFQNSVIEQVDRAACGFDVPRVFRSLAGDRVAVASADDRRHGVRLLSYVEGRPWSELSSHGQSLLMSLGRTVGQLSRALEGFSHPGMSRFCEWDLKNALRLRDLLNALGAEQRKMIEWILDHFEASLAPRLEELPTGVVHGDVNNDNVLVSGEEVVGVIDFGDAVHSARVFDVAIAIGYAMLGSGDPAARAQDVLDGCLEVLALEPPECALVFDLARIRIAMSVTYGAHYGALDPDNTYLTTNVKRGWQVLEQFDGKVLHPE